MSEEKCVRCGDVGEDRRTLRMACFYAMDELNVPFEEQKVVGQAYARTGSKELWLGGEEYGRANGHRPHLIPEYSEEPTGKLNTSMFTIRVCKECRGSWMRTIERWFNTLDERRKSPGTGIFVRENGTSIEVTEDEFYERRRRANERAEHKDPV